MFKPLRSVVALFVSALAFPLFSVSIGGASVATPHCIVSLSPTATETLFAIGAGHQVQVVDQDAQQVLLLLGRGVRSGRVARLGVDAGVAAEAIEQ